MKVHQRHWTPETGWSVASPAPGDFSDLVFIFGSRAALSSDELIREIQGAYPRAKLLGCSTAGEIRDTRVFDDSLVVTGVSFASTQVRSAVVQLADCQDAFAAGQRLVDLLPREGLVHVFVLADGTRVNGSELTCGMVSSLPKEISVTGGLAGDGDRFEQTLVFAGDAPKMGQIAAVGFYGERFHVGFGSLGGWDSFGPERLITKSDGNVLYELDGQPALALYKSYLGEHASRLPAAGLLFPLSLRSKSGAQDVVRTILGVDEKRQGMVFAGDMPVGSYARLMKANFDRLVDGAQGAARTSREAVGSFPPDLAILISCVGRKLVLKQRTEEEVESVREVLGVRTVLAGFYSYGEICPSAPNASCELHNQTMTVTTFAEQ